MSGSTSRRYPARFTGTARVPVWSGASAGNVRLNRGGYRHANWALHMIPVTQAGGVGPGKTHLQRQTYRGKDRTAAFRLLRRRLSDTVFTALRDDQFPRQADDRSRFPAAGVPVAARHRKIAELRQGTDNRANDSLPASCVEWPGIDSSPDPPPAPQSAHAERSDGAAPFA